MYDSQGHLGIVDCWTPSPTFSVKPLRIDKNSAFNSTLHLRLDKMSFCSKNTPLISDVTLLQRADVCTLLLYHWTVTLPLMGSKIASQKWLL